MTPFPNDPYCYPGTDVLINLADIRDQKALDRFEAQISSASIAHLSIEPITGPFDTARLQETHRRIFGRVYPWAGELRRAIGMMAKARPLRLCGRLRTFAECSRRSRSYIRGLEGRESSAGSGRCRDGKTAGLVLQRT